MATTAVTDPIIKPAVDALHYAVLRLPNGLQAILVHDPEADKVGDLPPSKPPKLAGLWLTKTGWLAKLACGLPYPIFDCKFLGAQDPEYDTLDCLKT